MHAENGRFTEKIVPRGQDTGPLDCPPLPWPG